MPRNYNDPDYISYAQISDVFVRAFLEEREAQEENIHLFEEADSDDARQAIAKAAPFFGRLLEGMTLEELKNKALLEAIGGAVAAAILYAQNQNKAT